MTLKGHEGEVRSAAYSLDGQRIVTASHDRTAKVWDAQMGQHIITLNGHNARLNSAVWSSDGKGIVTASWDQTAKVWNVETEKNCSLSMVIMGMSYQLVGVQIKKD